jgi:hypothetical protein
MQMGRIGMKRALSALAVIFAAGAFHLGCPGIGVVSRPNSGDATTGNYSLLPGTVAESRETSFWGPTGDHPVTTVERVPELIDGKPGTSVETATRVYVRMAQPHPLSHIVIRESNFKAFKVYVGHMGRTRTDAWKLVGHIKGRESGPIIVDVVAITDRVRIDVLTVEALESRTYGYKAPVPTAGEIELYGAGTSRDTVLGRHLPPVEPSDAGGLLDPFPGPMQPLGYIAESIARTSPTGMADIVIIATQTHHDETVVRVSLAEDMERLTRGLRRSGIDYRISTGRRVGMATVWSTIGHDVARDLTPLLWTESLPALILAMRTASDRGADVHLIYCTNGPVSPEPNVDATQFQRRKQARDDAVAQGIRVHMYGHNEAFQRDIAARSGGVFQNFGARSADIPDAEAVLVTLPPDALRDPCEAIAHSIGRWVVSNEERASDAVNVVLFIDHSASMQGRLRAVAEGLRALDRVLRAGGLDPTYTPVRFAENASTMTRGASGSTVSPPTDDIEDVPRLFRSPAKGDEYVVDSVTDALLSAVNPEIPNAVIILTDEPPRRRRTSTDDLGEVIETSGARCYVVMPVGDDTSQMVDATGAVIDAIETSGGMVFPMPLPMLRNHRNM